METKFKISIYWMLIGICMILHTQFSSMGLFFGASIAMPDANGTIPAGMYYFLVISMVLPFIFTFLQLILKAKWYKWVSFIWSALLILVNIFHFIETMFKEHAHVDQGVLLLFVLVVNVFLSIDLYKLIGTKQKSAE